MVRFITLFVIAFLCFECKEQEVLTTEEFEVVVIQASTGGTTAAIQSARLGARTLLVEPQQWLGGMLTSAGVSAIDGNHNMPAGLWGEFRTALRQHYGGAAALETGWVSNTLFEPHIGATIWQQLADAEKYLSIWKESELKAVKPAPDGWELLIQHAGQEKRVLTQVLIDATDLGDVAKIGAVHDIGMDSRSQSNESMAPLEANNIIQDFTYAAILKDYGEGIDKTIPKPANYNPSLFYCACKTPYCEDEKAHPCETMLNYGKLPNNKYMINWPIHGNDYYANMIEMKPSERQAVYAKAKEKTLQFIYFIQTELGYKHLGLADDEFPTADRLPFLPYHREGRRIQGLVRLDVNHILQPFDQKDPLYRTGIAVGDYPIDHHHKENPDAPEIDFPAVPSFNVPLGALLPKWPDRLIMADKAISVTNIVNGASRLQPVILQVGQAAGALAALAVRQRKSPNQISVREVQATLLEAKAYLMPYYDVKPEHPHFASIQRVGATGFIKGTGEAYKWANRTWFYPDTTIQFKDIQNGFRELYDMDLEHQLSSKAYLSIRESIAVIFAFMENIDPDRALFKQLSFLENFIAQRWSSEFQLQDFDEERPMTRTELAVLIDHILDPFHKKTIDIKGNFLE